MAIGTCAGGVPYVEAFSKWRCSRRRIGALFCIATCAALFLPAAVGQTQQYVYDEAGNIVEIRQLAAGKLAIFSFAPASGPVGTVVTIDGHGFSATPVSNVVTVNGVVAAVLTATATRLSIAAPTASGSGPIGISVGGASVMSPRVFTFIAGGPPPTNTAWNPADKGSNLSLSNGNLTVTQSTSAWQVIRATASATSGKKYFEVRQDTVDHGPGYHLPGVAKSGAAIASYIGSDASGWGYQYGLQRTVHAVTFPTYGASPVSALGTVIGVLLDLDAGTLQFTVNGAAQGVAYSGLSGTFYPALALYGSSGSTARFASNQWTYPPPAGYAQW